VFWEGTLLLGKKVSISRLGYERHAHHATLEPGANGAAARSGKPKLWRCNGTGGQTTLADVKAEAQRVVEQTLDKRVRR
jgi:hypothetical protein